MLVNPKRTKDEIVEWIRRYFDKNGGVFAVVGISGGKDSSVVAALCVEALGKGRVYGVLMPNGEQADIEDSYRIVTGLGIKYQLANIYGIVEEAKCAVGKMSEQATVNLPPRIRMAVLYAVAQSLPGGGRVANTCNRSEDFVGYSTKYGDSAGDFSPLANLMVHEVLQIGRELPIPAVLVEKTPSDGLCGKTDEENLGFTYAQIDEIIMRGTCGDESIDSAIKALHEKNLHKLRPMPAYGNPI